LRVVPRTAREKTTVLALNLGDLRLAQAMQIAPVLLLVVRAMVDFTVVLTGSAGSCRFLARERSPCHLSNQCKTAHCYP
jgi:hypothetical protein